MTRLVSCLLCVTFLTFACGSKPKTVLLGPANTSSEELKTVVPMELMPQGFGEPEPSITSSEPLQPTYLGVSPRNGFNNDSSAFEMALAIAARGSNGLFDKTSLEALMCSFVIGSVQTECPLKQASSIQAGENRMAYMATTDEGDMWMEAFVRDGVLVEIIIRDDESRRKQAAQILEVVDQRIQALAAAKS